MRTSINSVSVQGTPHKQSSNLYGKETSFHGVKTALFTLVSAAVLSGCLLEGDVSASKTRNELIAQLETTAASENTGTTEREVGETGGTGTATTGGSTSGSGTSSTSGSSGSSGSSSSSSSSGSSSSSSGSGTVPTTAALTNPAAMSDHYPGTHNYSKTVDLPSCDGPDALRISTTAGLSQITNSNYRVFCIAPGDYRSYGLLSLPTTGGTEANPRVIRFESSEFADSDEIFQANVSKLARMPAIDIRNTSNWVIHRLAFMSLSDGYMPMRLSGANNIVIDRIRLQYNRNGIEFRHGTHDSYLQNSFIGDQKVPQGSGNDGVCVAFMGHFRQHLLNGHIDYDYPVSTTNNSVVNNEIFNCNDGFQMVWMYHFNNLPDFAGTVIAGNDIYVDSSVRTNCNGVKSPNGDCAYTENPIDLKGGSLDASNPVKIFDNRMWGWRKTDSSYNPPANSWGSAIGGHYRANKNIEMYENVIWDVPSGISFSRGSNSLLIKDNIITQIRGEGPNNGIALIAVTDNVDLGTYNNVSDVTIERNHIIVSNDGSNTGAAWSSFSATNSSFSCNVVANGSWTSGNLPGSATGQNTYYNTNSGSLSRGTDTVQSSFNSANMGRLCFDTKRASITGGERVCLDDVLDTPNSSNACASDYWTTDNWPSS